MSKTRTSSEPYIGFDLDRTLAHYDHWRGAGHIGRPVKPMLDLVRRFLAAHTPCRVITARMAPDHTQEERDAFIAAWNVWSMHHLGTVLTVQAHKCMKMLELYDDRCVAVEPNTGKILSPQRQLP